MKDIQKARDVLAKWREGTAPGPWVNSSADPEWITSGVGAHRSVTRAIDESDTRLIVGTAGNPDLLDVLAGMLTTAYLAKTPDQVSSWFPRLAAAIIAADERMSA